MDKGLDRDIDLDLLVSIGHFLVQRPLQPEPEESLGSALLHPQSPLVAQRVEATSASRDRDPLQLPRGVSLGVAELVFVPVAGSVFFDGHDGGFLMSNADRKWEVFG